MRALILMAGMMLLAGCDLPVGPKNATVATVPTAAPTGLYADQRQALDKAKQLNQATQDDADAQRQAIERAAQ